MDKHVESSTNTATPRKKGPKYDKSSLIKIVQREKY
jgi:hypothetical protein